MSTIAAPPKPRTKTVHKMVADFAIKTADVESRTFEGTLSTSHLDEGDGWARDIVMPGAFKRTLDHFHADPDPYVPLINGHRYDDIYNVLGTLVDAREDLTGKTLQYELEGGGTLDVPEMLLWTKWQIIDGPDGARLLDRMRPGAVRKMSMGYVTHRSEEARLKGFGPARLLTEVSLREGSMVVFAMNTNAESDRTTIKSLAELQAALRAGTLTDEQKAELRALLDPPPADPPRADPADAPKELAPDAQQALRQRLLAIKLRGLATRTNPARHARA